MNRLRLKLMTALCFVMIAVLAIPQSAYASSASDRISGANRYETSAKIASEGWDTSNYAILVSGENFPDAICAAPLATRYEAPILLTSKNTLVAPTKNQLKNLKVKNVIIVGGEGVISAKVANEIKNMGINVSRAAGLNRYETSLEVAKMMGNFKEAVIATGSDFPDILSIAPIAAEKGMPILLTPKSNISDPLKNLLDSRVSRTYVLGDTNTISTTVVNKLPSPKRLFGDNPYEANIRIIEYFVDDLDLSTVYLATGEAYPDALSGSAYAALSNSPIVLVKSPLSTTSKNFFKENANYIDKVVAFGGDGVISDSLLESIASTTKTSSSFIDAPSNVVADTISSNQVHLSWNPVKNADSYTVYRATSYSGNYTKIANVSMPYYVDAYLPSGVTYYYKIQATNSSKTSDYSNIVQATTLSASNTLGAPTNFVATPLSKDEIYLTWDIVPDAITYNIYRTTADSGVYKLIDSVNYPSYSDKNVVTGLTYLYKVQAANSRGTGPYSTVVSASPLLNSNTLAVPTNVVASSIDQNQILVTWNVVPDANYYQVYRSTSYTGNYIHVGTLTLPYFIDKGLTPGMTYYYKVQSVSNAGASAYSTIAYTVTKEGTSSLTAPNNLSASALSSSQIYLAWNAVPNATYYKIYRSTTSTGNYRLIATNVNPFYTDENLPAGTTYYYYVEAANNTITSDKSNKASARTLK